MTLRVELLTIGNEILSGHTLDTNSQWLAQRLLELNLPVNQILVIEDNVDLIASAIKASFDKQTTLLITSGGLGPTFDDLTAEGLALAIETPLQFNPAALAMVTNRYKELKAQGLVETGEITPSRKKMARIPSNAIPLPNSVGTAPGIHLQFHGTQIYCLPGVPQELFAVFMEAVAPQIASLTDRVVLQQVIQVPILDESILAPIIAVLMKESQGVYLKSLPRPYQSRQPLHVAISVTAKTKTHAQKLLSEITYKLKEIAYTQRQIELALDR